MAKQELATIKFNDVDILTIKENDRVYVAMRDVCSGLGIDWEGQRQRIMLMTCFRPAPLPYRRRYLAMINRET